MTDEASETLKNRMDVVGQDGRKRFGKDWDTAIAAVHRGNPGGIDAATMGQLMSQPDPAGLLFTAGRETLLAEADGGDKGADRAYAAIRERERAAHRAYKGRG